MALNIKDEATDRVARELASLTGESITVAVRRSMEERLHRLRAQQRRHTAGRSLQSYIDRARARPLLDTRPEDEVLGYDEFGLPT
ncbi:type II toxin-antitoxin system VapB family antitoxin [Aestuariimicrobium ganziense]|uniref:type II toxin-antitoxin system VapB family antitoxin n=1 Tax=Aestuariimicrobium ganziense TaxID=2773677 RepID=UPI0019454E13|nr:type II toxin-antitoxin system VapB family antitoxin [Aestuariimicrobium ganziense]